MSFIFDAGADPQYGQTWDMDEFFRIAGSPLKVTAPRAGNINDLGPFDLPGDSGGFDYGYESAIETGPSVKMQVMMDIPPESPMR